MPSGASRIPRPCNWRCAAFDWHPEDCVYVGDSAEDMEMARRAGVRSIGILGPFPTHDRVRAANPYVLLESIAELPPLIDVLPAPDSNQIRQAGKLICSAQFRADKTACAVRTF